MSNHYTPDAIRAWDATDPYLITKRLLPNGACLRLHQTITGWRLTLALEEGDAGFVDVYDFSGEGMSFCARVRAFRNAREMANLWNGQRETDESFQWVRHMPSGRRRPMDVNTDDEPTEPNQEKDWPA
jgi:hypothetical protein